MRKRMYFKSSKYNSPLFLLLALFSAVELQCVRAQTPPNITQQPQGQDAIAGLTASFQVVASGSQPLTYQWKKDGVDISSGTSSILSFLNLQVTNAGLYSVVVSNQYGPTSSSNALLNVLLPVCAEAPAGIVSWWSDGSNDNADGNNPVGPTGHGETEWMLGRAIDFNGTSSDRVSLVDAENLKFTNSFSIEGWINLRSYPPGNAGPPGAVIMIRADDRACFDPYYLAVTTSGNLQLHVEDAAQTLPCGQNLNSAPLPVGRWQHVGAAFDADSGTMRLFTNGVLAAQTTTSVRPFRDLDPALHPGVGIGNYANYSGAAPFNGFIDELAVYNRALAESEMTAIYQASYMGKCTVRPLITLQPQNASVLVGGSNAFQVAVAGKLPLTFQWRKNGTNLTNDARVSGADTALLSIAALTTNDSGIYRVFVTNSFGSTISAEAVLDAYTDPRILVQPTNQRIRLTHTARFTSAGAGTGSLSYQWYLNGAPLADSGRITGSTTTNLVIQNVQSNDVGGYSLLVSNVNGVAGSAIANLTLAALHYVNAANPSPSAPYLTWASAATVIQDALDASVPGDWVIVTNGVYQSGGRVVGNNKLNRIVVTNRQIVVSVNGPAVTKILGNIPPRGGGTRCAWLGTGARLSGFTISSGGGGNPSGGFYDQSGGGIWCESSQAIVSNCVVSGNGGVNFGGGAWNGTLINCVLIGNGSGQGGGAYSSSLINCTVVGNSAEIGGGLGWCKATNSIAYFNFSNPFPHTNSLNTIFANSCTMPDPGGVGNITNEPIFVNLAGGNFHLQTNSPCINAGDNAFVASAIDFDGAPRIVGGGVDMGAYEYQLLPFIIVPPTNQSVMIFSNVAFAVVAVGEEPLAYHWQKDGVNLTDDSRISGTTSSYLTISNLLAQDAGSYQVVVTNALGSVTSAVAALTILGPPSISAQPVSRTVFAGTNASFSVTASALAQLYYQWRFNQTDLPGKTNTSLSLTNVQSANAGDYDVVITNIYGALTSSNATLTVLPASPNIRTQPVSRVASVGQNVSFTVVAKGSETISNQWQWNGVDLPGANAFTLTLTNVNSSFNGTYRAALSNEAGFALSTNATLTVSPVLMWGLTNAEQIQASGVSIPAAATNVMAIAAGGSLPCLALRADGTLVRWGNSPSDIAIPSNAVEVVAMSVGTSSGNYLALISDGTLVHWAGKSIPPLPMTITNANFVAVAAGGSHQLALRDDGTVVAWGSNTSGQTNVPPGATNVIAIAAGTSHSLALRADGTVVGWGLNSVGQATALSNVVNAVAIGAGGDQTLALRADRTVVGRILTNDSFRLDYGPPFGNTNNKIAIAVGRYHTLTLGADQMVSGWGRTNYGQLNAPPYATNVLAIAAGQDDSLALVRDPVAPPIPPRIGRPPLGRALKTGDNVLFNALAVGGLPLRYQWYRDGLPLAGRTNQWFALTSAHPSDAGNYQIVALNAFGSATSAVAVVSVSIPQPVLNSTSSGGNGFSFTFDSISGVLYISEFKTVLGPGGWTELDRRFGVGGTELVTDANTVDAARYYRVRALFAPTPQLHSATVSGGNVNFSFPTTDGAIYVVQYKTNLNDPVWLELLRQTGTGAPIVVNDPNPSSPSRFYRVKME